MAVATCGVLLLAMTTAGMVAHNCINTVIARSPCDEAIQTASTEKVWIASLRSQ
ncbi:hypothetical protein [Bradyrhizobium sp. CCBAU 11361]|uniref:hypothetical protein n=1 Tax=Bradyrhizobium sp. CCBAU 11361 TaxID=1630812 RepID=UPI002306943E|nr:hypothetical protein [Bradyrhizobium sp. CCBAU 11361]